MISEVWSLGLFWLLWDTGHHLKYSRSPSSVTTALKASVSTLQGQFYGTDFPGDSGVTEAKTKTDLMVTPECHHCREQQTCRSMKTLTKSWDRDSASARHRA